MPSFRYRALTQSGDLVSGSIAAPTAAEVAHRIEFLGLVPIETVVEDAGAKVERFNFAFWSRPRAEDVTVFTRDLALLLRAGARINDGLELLAQDIDVGRLRPTVAKISAAALAGESFAEAISRHPALFPPAWRCAALSGLRFVLGGRRAPLLSAVRAAAVCDGSARFQCQARPGGHRL